MNAETLRLLHGYNAWANHKILEAASRLSEEQFSAPANLSHGGIRSTLYHVYMAEHLWRLRCQDGISPSSMPLESSFPTFASLRAALETEQRKMAEYLGSLTDESINRVFAYKNLKGEPHEIVLWQALTHVVNHGTQHRAEVAVLLTDFGCSPGDVDMIYYFLSLGKA